MPGSPFFHNLTLGYKIVDSEQNWIASCVDDLTLQSDLLRSETPKAGWYRVISDDERLLRLIERQADPTQPLDRVMDPIADLFGTKPTPGPGGMIRVNDRKGASVAIAAPLPGERERPCELITAPLSEHQQERLGSLLKMARDLDFGIPLEGATHLHFDARPFQSAKAFSRLVFLLWTYGDTLKTLMGTNPHCRRLGPWPEKLLETVSDPGFPGLPWPQAQAQLKQVGLSKYCDFNLLNLVLDRANQNTIEVRILPVWLESGPILEAAGLFVALLHKALEDTPIAYHPPKPADTDSIQTLLESLPLSPEQRRRWLSK